MNKLHYWCYKILPLVYDDSLSYYEVLCKFRDKLNEVIESIDDIPSLIQEYLDTDEFKAYIAQLVDSLERGFVNVDNYGAKGDGVTNDYQAFVDAFEVGNELGIPVVASGTKTYAINATSPIIVKTDANFNGAKIKVLMTTGDIMFYIYQEPQTKTINQGGLSFDKVYDSDLFNKMLHITSPLSLGLRNGFGTPMYHEQVLVTDGAGHFVNAIYFPEIINGDYNITYFDINFKNLTFENVVFETTDSYGCTHIRCNRNNTTIQNIGFVGNSSFVGNGFTSMIWIQDGYNITVNNVVGEQAWPRENTGYLIGYAHVSDCVIENVRAQWRRGDAIHGDLGGSEATNMTFRNCNCYRFDCHYEMMGYWHIYDCTFLTGHVCGGWGTFEMDNCTLPKNWNAEGGSIPSMPLDRRNDVSLPYSGIITFRNITVEGDTGLLDYTMSGHIVDDARPPLDISHFNFSGTKLILDNIVTGSHMTNYNFLLFRDNLTWGGTPVEDRYTYHLDVYVKNMHNTQTAAQVTGWGTFRSLNFEDCEFDNYLTLALQVQNISFRRCKLPSVYFLPTSSEGYHPMSGDYIMQDCEFENITNLETASNGSNGTLKILNNKITADTAKDFSSANFLSHWPHAIVNNNVIAADTKINIDDWNSILR